MRILLAEDHPDLAANLGEFLSGHGHKVKFAMDGDAALRLAQTGRYDAIVLDRMLPGLDGASVCRQAREAGTATPVLMLTALDTVEDKLAGFAAGADDYLVKPFAMAELLVRLHALHRRAGGAPEARVLRVADLTLDLDSLEVRRGGDRLLLPRAPLKLLELLMREQHRVVTRAELEQALWGAEPPVADVLRAHMWALRSAIDRPYPRRLLNTIHGIGYRLADLEDF
jgi:DNA-binding response OmpR family regulator